MIPNYIMIIFCQSHLKSPVFLPEKNWGLGSRGYIQHDSWCPCFTTATFGRHYYEGYICKEGRRSRCLRDTLWLLLGDGKSAMLGPWYGSGCLSLFVNTGLHSSWKCPSRGFQKEPKEYYWRCHGSNLHSICIKCHWGMLFVVDRWGNHTV